MLPAEMIGALCEALVCMSAHSQHPDTESCATSHCTLTRTHPLFAVDCCCRPACRQVSHPVQGICLPAILESALKLTNLLCCCTPGAFTKTRDQSESVPCKVVAALLADVLATLRSLLAITTAQRAAPTLPSAASQWAMKESVCHMCCLQATVGLPPRMSMSSPTCGKYPLQC